MGENILIRKFGIIEFALTISFIVNISFFFPCSHYRKNRVDIDKLPKDSKEYLSKFPNSLEVK
jgi:hypothetical protein